jgi:NAD(P)-dependent dehydrogenase (short-subunit alcohol dehydrogenase family)
MRLSGKVAMVTGAGSGIGRATAERLAQEGAKVLIADRDQAAGRQTLEGITAQGGDASFCLTDVSKASDVQNAVQAAIERYGKLNVLVNNAAVQVMAQLVDTSEEVWDQIHSVNLKGVFLGCKYAIPAMIRSGAGSVVNVASVLGLVGDPELAAYCAAKGGVIALTRVAALTYGPQRVRVNCICPGDVETPLVKQYFEHSPDPVAARELVSSKYALGRIAEPKEIANTIAFLASDESSFVTGATLVVDGALTVKCY